MEGGGGLSGGTIAGIVVVAVAAIAITAGLAWFFWWRKRRHHRQQQRLKRETMGSTIDGARSASMDATTAVDEQEMTGQERVEEYFAKTHRPSDSHADESGFLKIELDANSTARGNPTSYARHELPGDSVRPTPRSGVSWGSGYISPMGPDARHLSMGFGEPSPPLGGGLPPGHSRNRTISDGSVPGVSPRSQHTRQSSDGSVPSVEERPVRHERMHSDGSIGVVHEIG